jgi:hypothetical protein
MSQSDYIKRKQVAQTLRADGLNAPISFPAVFSSQELLKYKQYQIVNNDSNTKIDYNLITPTGKKIVFDMERNVTNCPTFVVCRNTNTRPNRVLNPVVACPFSNEPLTWKETKNRMDDKSLCRCQLKRKHINRNVCSCGVSQLE